MSGPRGFAAREFALPCNRGPWSRSPQAPDRNRHCPPISVTEERWGSSASRRQFPTRTSAACPASPGNAVPEHQRRTARRGFDRFPLSASTGTMNSAAIVLLTVPPAVASAIAPNSESMSVRTASGMRLARVVSQRGLRRFPQPRFMDFRSRAMLDSTHVAAHCPVGLLIASRPVRAAGLGSAVRRSHDRCWRTAADDRGTRPLAGQRQRLRAPDCPGAWPARVASCPGLPWHGRMRTVGGRDPRDRAARRFRSVVRRRLLPAALPAIRRPLAGQPTSPSLIPGDR